MFRLTSDYDIHASEAAHGAEFEIRKSRSESIGRAPLFSQRCYVRMHGGSVDQRKHVAQALGLPPASDELYAKYLDADIEYDIPDVFVEHATERIRHALGGVRCEGIDDRTCAIFPCGAAAARKLQNDNSQLYVCTSEAHFTHAQQALDAMAQADGDG